VVVVKSLPGTRESGGSGIVQHQPFEILYLVRNLGAAAAHDVAVHDPFAAQYFDVISVNGVAPAPGAGGELGPTLFSVGTRAPGANATARVVIVGKISGTMTVARATVAYKYHAESDEGGAGVVEAKGLSTAPGKVEIAKPEHHARVQALTAPASHTLAWALVSSVALGVVGSSWFSFVKVRGARAKQA
jgi:hypothetical protein